MAGFDLTFSSRLASAPREPELRSRKTRSSRVCRTTSAGIRGFDLKRPFILAPSSTAAAADPSGGEGKGGAAGLLRPADPKEKQPLNSATGSPSRGPRAPAPPRGARRREAGRDRTGRGGEARAWVWAWAWARCRCRARDGARAVVLGVGRYPYPPVWTKRIWPDGGWCVSRRFLPVASRLSLSPFLIHFFFVFLCLPIL